ncbi:hypothetical protein Sme01_17990 [Sphaerisporangium melleum]|uniref:Pyrrolo-quinoline quinone repeat domain-containing protein n=1 Tax=Sphaerisporangium melleum TaxID=321316 RepID=A0A917VHQ5_9ACTN|nr:PQQ-binding-like beta-propeller repeat protein [Sphaerisporangium melleum]GGK83880.1 hypothetical protein GCM10007964_27930 [Sphaerisporangium melleum]GII69323.1 hypothetical protein Sme01_17990 [Sphaerisporangium melleum]
MRRVQRRAPAKAGLVLAAAALLAVPGAQGVPADAGFAVPEAAPPASGVTVTVDDGVAEGRDGRRRTVWRSAATGRAIGTLDGTASYGRYLVRDAEAGQRFYFNEDDGKARRITVVDALTGSVRWTMTSGRREDGPGRPYFYLLGLAAGRAIVDVPALGAVHALNLADGGLGWTARLPDGCRSLSREANVVDGEPSRVVDEREAALLARCDAGRVRLIRIDARTGALGGQTTVRPAGEPKLHLAHGVAVVTTPHSISIVTPGGRVAYERARAGCQCDAAVAGDTAVVIAQDGSAGGTEVAVVRLRSGEVVARHAYSKAELAGGDDRRGLVFVGRTVPYPLMIWNPMEPVDVWDARAGRLLTTIAPPLTAENDAVRAAAIGGGWGARGGVAAGAWPDACALIPPEALAERTGTAYLPGAAGRGPAELGLATPVSCALAPRTAGRTPVTVTVSWVYGSEEQATAAMRTLRTNGTISSSASSARVRGAGEAVHIDEMKDSIMMRVGSTLVLVEAYGESSTAMDAARIAAGRLGERR